MKRVATSLVLIPLVIWVVLAAPFWMFAAVLAAVGLLAFHEFDGIAEAHGIARAGLPGMAAGLVLLFAPEPFLVLALTALAAMMLALLANSRKTDRGAAPFAFPSNSRNTDRGAAPFAPPGNSRKTDHGAAPFAPPGNSRNTECGEPDACGPGGRDLGSALTGASVFLLGVVYIFGAWRCAMGLREINPHWLMIALLVSWAGDTAALYIGRAFGTHKLAPRVSPGKTWEGFWGSVAGGTLAAGIYAHYLIPPAPLGAVLALAAAANIAGQMGDLCESAFKRGAGIKDSGTMLPGHGGWLDRIDSSLFSVPVVYATLDLMLKYVHV